MIRKIVIAAAMAGQVGSASAAEPLQLFAAGSLRDAMTAIAAAYEKAGGSKVETRFGASGLLRDALVKGETADVFASANMEHPQSLAKAGKAGPVRLFARNALCAFGRPGVDISQANVLDRMLDPAIKLGTSTPKADPAGDYAYEVFAKAEAVQAGARARLEAKALNLTGGASSPAPKPGRNIYGDMLESGSADVFLAYCTNERPLKKQLPGATMIALPDRLAVGADYGLTVLQGAGAEAAKLADFILSPAGREILRNQGFATP